MLCSSLLLGLIVSSVAAQTLLQLSPAQRHRDTACLGHSVESCVRAELDMDLLQSGTSIQLPAGQILTVSRRGEHSVVFKNREGEAIFVWNGPTVAGSVHIGGVSWVLEGCGHDCFLWIKQKNNWLDETTAPNLRTKDGFFHHPKN